MWKVGLRVQGRYAHILRFHGDGAARFFARAHFAVDRPFFPKQEIADLKDWRGRRSAVGCCGFCCALFYRDRHRIVLMAVHGRRLVLGPYASQTATRSFSKTFFVYSRGNAGGYDPCSSSPKEVQEIQRKCSAVLLPLGIRISDFSSTVPPNHRLPAGSGQAHPSRKGGLPTDKVGRETLPPGGSGAGPTSGPFAFGWELRGRLEDELKAELELAGAAAPERGVVIGDVRR